ncbi:PE domain-containing protein, partial [Amycolatopsis sp. H20-H5]|uniref:PE domain-containing protein n=1 Tax=Amycolatopsis sp. H20-H5 TaxID=3046309 RepID=UPI002DC05E51
EGVERVRHVASNFMGPLVPGYKYLYDLPPAEVAKQTADEQAKVNAAMDTGGGGYKFDPATADAVIKDLNELLGWISKEHQQHARQLASIKPMGDEVASANYVQDANAAGQSYGNYLNSVIAELTRQLEAVKTARDTYLAQEQHNASALKGKHSQNA